MLFLACHFNTTVKSSIPHLGHRSIRHFQPFWLYFRWQVSGFHSLLMSFRHYFDLFAVFVEHLTLKFDGFPIYSGPYQANLRCDLVLNSSICYSFLLEASSLCTFRICTRSS